MPEHKTLCEIADLFGVTLDYLYGRTDRINVTKDTFTIENLSIEGDMTDYTRAIRKVSEENGKKLVVRKFINFVYENRDTELALMFCDMIKQSNREEAINSLALNGKLYSIVEQIVRDKNISIY